MRWASLGAGFVVVVLARLLGAEALSSGMAVPKAAGGFLERLTTATGQPPRFAAAPMVGQSDLAFRLLCQRHGTEICWTQMIHARNFVSAGPKFRKANFDPLEACEGPLATGPLVAQLAGDDPKILVEAAHLLLEGGHRLDAVDLNLGCPQAIARKGHYGAFLLREPKLVATLVTAMARELPVPVTAKIRVLPEGRAATVDFARMLEASGAALVTCHGRTQKQNKNLCGAPDLGVIRAVNGALTIPVLANGGIETTVDALNVLRTTGCAGVMSSEALLENPALFSPAALTAAEAEAEADAEADEAAGEFASAAVGVSLGLSMQGGAGARNGMPGAVFGAAAAAAQAVAGRQLAFCAEYLELAEAFPPAYDFKGDGGTPRAHAFKFLHQILSATPAYRDQLVRAGSTADIFGLVDDIAEAYHLPPFHPARGGASDPALLRAPPPECAEAAAALGVPAVGPRSWYRRYR